VIETLSAEGGVQPQLILESPVELMLNSRQLSESETVFEFQQNLDNCIGESGKIKHLMDGIWRQINILF